MLSKGEECDTLFPLTQQRTAKQLLSIIIGNRLGKPQSTDVTTKRSHTVSFKDHIVKGQRLHHNNCTSHIRKREKLSHTERKEGEIIGLHCQK